MENQKSSQEYYCLLVRDNSDNNYYICFKYSQKKLTNKPKIRWDKLLKIGTAIIITLLTSLTPVNEETLDSQTQTIQTIENYTTITRLILEFYGK
ncbi:hypothetical protein ACP6PL_24465 [Dapis sp. BLCC M126]|uniref:hypothetical protein n=1 Tax=Dapis sp. BLCC M126 TaxID=3400189 RepID=UPI003CF2C9B0